MTCFKPLVGVKYKLGGKDYFKVFPNLYEPPPERYDWFEQFPIPCGKCIGCRLDKSKQWADRLMMEWQESDSACFLTLTYSNEFLEERYKDRKKKEYLDVNTGEILPSPYQYDLCKEDIQDFMKRLRRYVDYKHGKKVRFFACGEYGDKNNRPHYHIILFNYDFSDCRTPLYRDKNGYQHYVSDKLYDHLTWKDSKSLWKYGICDIANVSWSSCAYVARYVNKKLYGDSSELYTIMDYVPEFSLMSRNPGIGRKYFEDHIEEYENGSIWIPDPNKGAIEVTSNKYFERLISEDPFIDEDYKIERKKIRAERSKAREKARLEKSKLSYLDQNAVDLKHKENVVKSLKRSL